MVSDLAAALRFSLGIRSFNNLSFLGQNQMDNLLKAHSEVLRKREPFAALPSAWGLYPSRVQCRQSL
jgi:hypothetical protein